MTFVRKSKNATYKWPVSAEYPADGGRFETETFDALYRRLGRSDFDRLIEKGDLQLIEAVLAGWEGVKDEQGNDVPFSKAVLTEMLDDPCFVRGVIKSYVESLEGAKVKN